MANYTLQLLHMSDGEGSTLSTQTAPVMGALIDRFDGQYANTLVLAGGDNYIPGPFLTAGADPALNRVVGATALGRPDVAIYNAFGVKASAIGNHEFDLGSQTVADAITPSGAWGGARFPYLSANLDFSGDAALRGRATAGGQPSSAIAGRIAPSTIVTVNGERIGVVGATTQLLERISSPTGTEVNGFPKAGEPGDNLVERDDMALLASQLQPAIDALIAQGVNKIVLQSHLQLLSNEQALAPLLRGVDIILAAGSHTRLSDATDVQAAFPGHDATSAGPYPIVTAGADGAPTMIVATDSESTYLGRLVVDFDENGRIVPGSLNPAVSGTYAATQATLQAAYGADIARAFAPGSIGARVREVTDAVGQVISTKERNVYGFTGVYLEGDRAFGRAQETNLGDLSADANAAAAARAVASQPYLVSLKNGGGIRASIGAVSGGSGNDPNAGAKLPPLANAEAGKPAGGVSQLDVENALRFDNKLMVFDTTAQGLKNILEYGAGLAPGNGGYPQIGGVKFSYDPSQPAGSKVRSIALTDEAGTVIAKVVENGAVLPNAPARISVVSLNFTANGGDGYPTKQNGDNFRYLLGDGRLSAPVDKSLDFTAPANVPANVVGEQAAFAQYMQARYGTADKPYGAVDTASSEDLRIQNLSVRADTVFNSGRFGTGGGDSLAGTAGTDEIFGYAGNDTLAGGQGNDSMLGGDGSDLVSGQDGDDAVLGGAGNDFVSGGAGNDSVNGEAGDDLVFGDEGDDIVDGGAGNDRVYGGTGADRVFGSAGSDLVFGEQGNDFVGAGEGNDFASGGAGNDEVHGESGDDYVFGDEGDDQLFGGEGRDSLYGGLGSDVLDGDAGDDLLAGEQGDDVLMGGAGSDYLSGGLGSDQLFGGDGADLLFGNAGNDSLSGGRGSDIFAYGRGDGQDVIRDFTVGGSERDVIAFNGGVFTSFAAVQAATQQLGADAVITVGAGDSLTLQNVQVASLSAQTFTFA
ncbi:5'-nucleotidase C-terminal domain-containing protein [Methylobacterium sp. WSM2598]|uniref:5'-nucleotidase C-terminal domain-containing protein n=1 Tax=Methylobacterium sp. WSM2598 TaxID=398261 RepID=UPI00036E6542|nr:5'-nucleotidase C-terminal domain-containing protein [Methylobacterium sp. WSM2598]